MRKLLFTTSIIIALLGQLTFVLAQSVSDADRRQIERELERQISQDTGDNVRVRVTSAQASSTGNREMSVRGQATVEGRRGQNGRSDIWYDAILDTRRNSIIRTNWSYGRNDDRRDDRDRYNTPQTGALRPGRYEIQVVETKRLLVATNNGQVVQSNSGNARSRQWDIEEAGNGYYYIRSADSGEVLTVSGNGDSGSNIILAEQGRSRDAQLWDIRTENDNSYRFLAPTGRSLDAPGNERYDGARLQIFKRNSGDNQRFWLRWIGASERNRDRYRDRDRDRNRDDWYDSGRSQRSGSLRWRGRVDDVVEIEIRGDQIYERTVSGQPVTDVGSRFNSVMPRRRVNVSVEKFRGRGNVEIVEQPSSRNEFTTVVRIRDTKGGSDDYEIEVYWN